uniref:RB-associated KRAB zinc finger protein-like n=1 Tax=Doryrhamphus excisus TaxID=161450 RepID=UPI0025AE487D|nr:RB-associated KRAB zinc finger protein-like [Doryrhamphus excisus]
MRKSAGGGKTRQKLATFSRVVSVTKMLKELVKERLMAAADEIFALFERTIASYEEELCRTKEENERQRRQLEAVSKTRTVLHIVGAQQLFGRQEEEEEGGGGATGSAEDPQPAYVKEEEEEVWTTQEGKCLLWPEETDPTKLQPTGVSVKTEALDDKPASSSEENRGAEPPRSSSPRHMTSKAEGDHLFAPLLDSDDGTSQHPEDDTREPLSSDTDREGHARTHTDDKRSECSQKKTDVRRPVGRQEERPPATHQEDPQPFCVKEEEEELWSARGEECLLWPQEADVTELPLTVVCVKTEDQEDKPQARSDSDDTEDDDWDDPQEPLSSDADPEGDMRTGADGKRSKCCKKRTGKERFTCEVCGESFSFKSYLTRHLRIHTGEKPFSCAVCGERFAQKSNMTTHMRKHTGEKPFSCSICGERFSRKYTMSMHMVTHTGEKPFQCAVCGERFAQKSNVKAHMRTHTGEKPFSCPVCGERFAHKSNMLKHARTHASVGSVHGQGSPMVRISGGK